MTEIYVVTEGEYSDYHIVGVYDDKALAEQAADIDEGDVKTYTVNEHADLISQGLKPYKVYMDRDGNVDRDGNTGGQPRRVDVSGGTTVFHVWMARDLIGYSRARGGPIYRDVGLRLRATVWARDEQHAVKIVNEKRAQLIAAGLFVDGYEE